jgi:sucrose-6-phosphate hydrolase SacC (GH32 family)
MAWGRIEPAGMPFNQMMLFPTEFKLVTTPDGLRMRATPIAELASMHSTALGFPYLSAADANQALKQAGSGPSDIKFNVRLENDGDLNIGYEGNTLATIHGDELENSQVSVEILLDKAVAEIFVHSGARYIVRELPTSAQKQAPGQSLELSPSKPTTTIGRLAIYPMQSLWNSPTSSQR